MTTPLNRSLRGLTGDQIERIGDMVAENPEIGTAEIARKVGAQRKLVGPFVKAFRQVNDMLEKEQKTSQARIEQEVLDAYHAPGAGIHNDKRKANGDYDFERIYPDDRARVPAFA